MVLCCHWSRRAASDEARTCAEAMLVNLMQRLLPFEFELEVFANPQHDILPGHLKGRVEIHISGLHINTDRLADDLGALSQHIARGKLKPILAGDGGMQLVVHWLQTLMSRPLARWLCAQIFEKLALQLGASWIDEHDSLGPLRLQVAELGHRIDPAVRRAVLEAARAKNVGSRLGRFAKAIGRAKLGSNRNHLHVELKVYFLAEVFRGRVADRHRARRLAVQREGLLLVAGDESGDRPDRLVAAKGCFRTFRPKVSLIFIEHSVPNIKQYS